MSLNVSSIWNSNNPHISTFYRGLAAIKAQTKHERPSMFAFDNTTYNKLTFNLNYCAMDARINEYLINLLDNLRTQLTASLFYYYFF